MIDLMLAVLIDRSTIASACSAPNVPTRVLNAISPRIPALAQDNGVGGKVTVRISLDANSTITNGEVVKSDNVLLNAASVESAKHSIFATKVVDCIPVASTYDFVVDFSMGPYTAPTTQTEPRTYLKGEWDCTDANGVVRHETYAYDPDRLQITHDIGDLQETFTLNDRAWHRVSSAGPIDQRGSGWDWYSWRFVGTIGAQKIATSYFRSDENTFRRSTDDKLPKPQIFQSDVCKRAVSVPKPA